MISGGDESARNAFRAYLRDESSQRGLVSTEEMTAADVLEVKNLADAIARAEEALRLESSRPRSTARDMFAELASSTDDIAGPAVFAAPTPTPVPPAPATEPILFLPNDEDAFLQPAGRIRSLADETLDGYRPEATLEVRIRTRRKSASVIVAAVLAVLAVVVAAAFARGGAEPPEPLPAKPTALAEPAVKPEPAPVAKPAPSDTMPVMDVRSLPTAR